MQRIRKGDEVVATADRDKGRRGTVIKVFPNGRVLVENINMVKKHQKPNPNQGIAGGIIEKEMPLHASNVMLYNPVSKKGDRVGVKVLEDGDKKRLAGLVFAYTFHFVQHTSRLHLCYPVFDISFALTLADFQRLFGHRHIGEDPYPDLAVPLDVAGRRRR